MKPPTAICREVCEQPFHLRRRMYASAATLLSQPGPQRGPLPHLQLGPLPGSFWGPHPALQPGDQQGHRREYQCFGGTADLKTFQNWGIAELPDVRNQQRTEHIQQLVWAVMAATCTFYEKEGARASCRHDTLCNFGGLLRKAFLHPTDRMCLLKLRPIYTQSCGKETPCGKSPSDTRIGSQALLDRLVFRGAAHDPEMFSVADRQEKNSTPLSNNSDACSQGSARPHIRCHEAE